MYLNIKLLTMNNFEAIFTLYKKIISHFKFFISYFLVKPLLNSKYYTNSLCDRPFQKNFNFLFV
jgi:hypothetical protein